MKKKKKKVLFRIILSALLLIAVFLINAKTTLPPLLLLFLCCIPYLVIGYDILWKAILGILHGEVFDENFLMSVATIGAFLMREYWEAAAVMLFYQVGELFQSFAVDKSRRNIAALMDIRPDFANVAASDGSLQQVDPETVSVGDCIVIRPGERVPLDGVITEGHSTLNTSALTGESIPRDVAPGDDIYSGCINNDGVLQVRVSKPFAESTVARILDLVENSSLKKAKAEHFITKFARYYTPIVCLGALCLAIIPSLLTGQWNTWIRRALTFLVISCPCALVISIPLTFFGAIGGASRCGILIKGSNYLEVLAKTKTIVFDKTGTLTKGVFQVTSLVPAPPYTDEQLLAFAVLAESYSNHPIANSLKEAYGKPVDQNKILKAQELPGYGMIVQTENHAILAGNARLMEQQSIPYVPNTEIGTIVYLAVDTQFVGSIVISDVEKPTARQAISDLRMQGIRTVLLTGDSSAAANHIAQRLGIDEVHSNLLPDNKIQWVENLLIQKPANSTLAFVGDGINDAPVLRRSDVGIAMGALGADAAIEAADIVLMDDDPAKISLALQLARVCKTIVWENIVFSLAVKAGFLLLCAVGYVSMWWAVFADVGVMIVAVLNATRMLHLPFLHGKTQKETAFVST
ncbi:MAG: cadmium-translocating P-type ATPase [Oscillospiraceae bacterium]|nr:cadmium-translocating P-type ATPase [Oscillospiraceae bacterium]